MRLNLKTLEKVVNEEKVLVALRKELKSTFGSSILAEGTMHQVAVEANDTLDILEHTGKLQKIHINQNLIRNLMEHSDKEVRKFVARVIDKKNLGKFTKDRSDIVRAAAAKRLSLQTVNEMCKKFPFDDQLSIIRKQKLLTEGLPEPKKVTEPFDMYGKKRLGSVVKQYEGDELSDCWYEEQALKFMMDYGDNIEDGWEEIATHRFVASTKATSGVELDEKKLLDAIKEKIFQRDERALAKDNCCKHNTLKETVAWLNKRSLNESNICEIDEEDDEIDEVANLVKNVTSPSTYIEEANKLFKIKHSIMPSSIKKFRLGECTNQQFPAIGYLPHTMGFRSIDERALNVLCKHWTNKQLINGESLQLEWSTHPVDINKICFTVVMK